MKILIIIPAYNEERALPLLLREIQSLYPQYDTVVINDGSRDRTREAAEKEGFTVVSLPFNLGIGGAMQTGFKIAVRENYDVAVQMDGDAQHDPRFLPQILGPVLSGELDLCIGSRFLSGRSAFQSTFSRRLGIRFFARLLGWMTGLYLTDPTSGFRAVGKNLIRRFAEYYPVDFPEPEAIQMAKRFGAKMGEVPVQMRKRLGGTSSIRYFATLYYMVKVTLAILIDALKRKK